MSATPEYLVVTFGDPDTYVRARLIKDGATTITVETLDSPPLKLIFNKGTGWNRDRWPKEERRGRMRSRGLHRELYNNAEEKAAEIDYTESRKEITGRAGTVIWKAESALRAFRDKWLPSERRFRTVYKGTEGQLAVIERITKELEALTKAKS